MLLAMLAAWVVLSCLTVGTVAWIGMVLDYRRRAGPPRVYTVRRTA